MPRLTENERMRAIGMSECNISQREIARRLNCNHTTIGRLLDRYQQTRSSRDRQRTGRPRVTTPAVDGYIVNLHLRNRFLPAADTARRLNNVSGDTVRRRLTSAGLTSRRPHLGLNLTRRHRQQRLLWAQAHVRWTRNQWMGVLFSDESRFNLQFADGRIRVWRRQGERFSDACVIQHDRFGGGSVHVWGGFSFNHRLPLNIFRTNVNAITYINHVLQPLVVPAFRTHQELTLFQQDNARAHTALRTQQYLEAENITTLPWPALSPDMAPIEHVWDEISRRVYRNNPPGNLNELEAALQREWDRIPQEFFQRLVSSMRRRCMACIQSRGGHTRY